jgi:copper chaperone CopZ
MYGVENEAHEELVWFAPATAHEVIQSQGLKTGSEIIVKLTGKNKVEVSILGKAAEPEHTPKTDSLKDVMIQSMRDAAEIVAAVPDLGFRAEDSRAIGLSLFIART